MGIDVKSGGSQPNSIPQNVDHSESTDAAKTSAATEGEVQQKQTETLEQSPANAQIAQAMKGAGTESQGTMDSRVHYLKKELGDRLPEKKNADANGLSGGLAGGGGEQIGDLKGQENMIPLHAFSGGGEMRAVPAGGTPFTMFATNLKKDPNFKKLDPSIKEQILKQAQQNPRDTAAIDQLQRIATDPNFGKVSKDVQKQILNRMDQLPIEMDTDKVKNISVDQARDQLRQLATDPNFAKLSPDAQKIALNNLAKLPDSPSNLVGVKEGVKAAVQLESNSEFKRLDPDIKKQVLEFSGQNGLSPTAREQLIKLATTPDLKNPAAARAFLGAVNYDQLKELTRSKGGEKLLQSMEKQMKTGGQADQANLTRIENARKAAQVEGSQDFGKLSPTEKDAVRKALEKSQFNADSTRSIAGLVYTGDLKGLPNSTLNKVLNAVSGNADPAVSLAIRNLTVQLSFKNFGERTQNAMLDAVIAKHGDPAFMKSLKDLHTDPGFKALGDTAGAKVVADLMKFTETPSYKKMLPVDREQAVKIISKLAVHSAGNPTFAVARNTLDRLINGRVPMAVYRDEKNASDYGKASKGVMMFNLANPSTLTDVEELVDTAAHEVNHVVNGHTPAGTPNRFLDEYRAWMVGRAAVGKNPPTADDMKEIVANLVTNAPNGSSYDHLRKLYKNDAQFRKVVDEVVKGLNSTPPKITTPEELREKMKDFPRTDYGVGAGAGSDKDLYLNTPGNVDNR